MLGGGGDQWASAAAAVPGGGWLIGGTDTAVGDGDVALWRSGTTARSHAATAARPSSVARAGNRSAASLDDDWVLIAGTDYGRAGIWESDTIDR